jgi:RHS repeat-associated protein
VFKQAGPPLTLPNGITVNYTYDAANRLTALEYRKSDGTVIERLTYDFDAKGQIVARGSVNAVSQTETALTAEYDAADRMTSVTLAPGTPQARTYSLAYDADGNLTDKTHTTDPADRTTFTWDSRQRLARLDAPGLTATFAYDVLGRRTERRITKAGEPARITQYVYDGAQAVGELRVAQGPISAQATSLITGLALDEALARVTRTGAGTPELRAFVTDHLGSVLAQAREDQSVATSFTYSAYGETAVAGEQPADSLGYTAREDDGTGLYFYRARHYDPVLKRFVQPLDFALGDACQRPFSSENLSRLCVDIHTLSYVVSLSKLAR